MNTRAGFAPVIRLVVSTLSLLIISHAATAADSTAAKKKGPVVVTASQYAVTPPLRDVAGPPTKQIFRRLRSGQEHEQPLGRIPRPHKPLGASPEKADPVVQRLLPPVPLMPDPMFTFEGIDNIDGVYPPDCNGDVGLNHYVEMVNLHMCIYDKATGTNVVAPFLMSSLFAAAGFSPPASNTDDGDPIVLYDHLANRWFISQFIVSVTPPHEVIGISQTADPTGAWYLYDFVMPNTKMNDYPHFGMWPDAYYMTDNQFSGFSWGGAGVFAFDRAKMIAGDPSATYQYFDLFDANQDFGGMLPADLDGPPPPAGTPGYFLMVDDSLINPFDAMYLWEFHVDWTNPANTTFGNASLPNRTNLVAEFDSAFTGGRNNIPQPGTAQKLDAIADRLMHRVQYRYFGGYESLVASHTVDVGTDHAGVRWYQMRRDLPAGNFEIADQGTFAPDAAHRWMGSAAMDGQGNMAIGYSISSSSIFPSIRYAGRLSTDPTGGLYQGEAELYAGSGSQTGTGARWGDYTMLSVDPADDVTFWYVSEYYPVTAAVAWHTRIGTFRLGFPEQGVVTGRVTDALSGAGIAGAQITSDIGFSTPTLANGAYALSMKTGLVSLTATALDYEPSSPAPVTIMLDATTSQNFALSPVPLRVLPHTGLAASGLAGGPFTPSEKVYVLTNASAAPFSWSASHAASWIDVSPTSGSLAVGAATSVLVHFNFDADFLAAGNYADTLTFSNITAGTSQGRPVSLAVEPYLVTIACEDFSSGLPAGWLVLTNGAQQPSAAWRFDSPGGRANLTGGSGTYAAVDDDIHGSSILTDTELITPEFDLSDVNGPLLEFKTDFVFYESEVVDVDVSTSGAFGPWSNIWTRNDTYNGSESISLADVAGESSVTFRFHYRDFGGWGYWWQVDDVCIKGSVSTESGSLGITPVPGLSASGYAGGPFGPNRLYRLTNESAGAIAWSATPDVAWVDVTPSSGNLAGHTTIDVAVDVNGIATSLLPGAYSGEVAFSNITEGAGQSRPLSLDVREPLVVTPDANMFSEGLEGGPFTPPSKVYTVSNAASHAVQVTVEANEPWLSLSSSGAVLAGGENLSITGTLIDAALTVPGIYSDAITFSNVNTLVAQSRAVTVVVVEIRGDLDVFDSVAPTNDFDLPFGMVAPYTSATQSILLVNSDSPGGRGVTVNDLYLGYVQEDFSDGEAQGWREDVPPDWYVAGGLYNAQAPGENFLTSVYTASVVRADVAIQAMCSRDGTLGWAQGVALRVSDDFDADGIGSGYSFLTDGGAYYSVFWEDGVTFGALQDWTLSTALHIGGTNTLLASAEGSTLRFFINGTLVWSGTDTRFSTGRVAVIGFDDSSDQPTYFFDNIIVQPPVKPVSGIGGKQRYLNSFPFTNGQRYGTLRAEHTVVPPAPSFPPEPLSNSAPLPPFSLANLPTLPITLEPGETLGFDVVYSPQALGTNHNVVTVQSDDNDEPLISVAVNGRPGQGLITGTVISANSSFGLVGATVTADDGINSWTTTTTTNGFYSLPVLQGTLTVTATLANYTTGAVYGVSVSDAGSAEANFVLEGSELTYAPTGMVMILNYGQSQTNMLWLTNSGPLTIDVGIAARIVNPLGPVHIPAFTGSVPASADAPSHARAGNMKRTDDHSPGMSAPSHVLCYGIDMDAQRLVSFYADDPGTLTGIGSTGSDLIPAVDFLNYDFSRLYAINYDANTLVRISTADASMTTVGASPPASGQSWTGLAASPDGTLYAASTDGSSSKLYTINPDSGAVTFVGNITGAPGIIALACDPDGMLYGLDIVNDALFTVDPSTGAGAMIGSIGFDANYAQGMDFDEMENVLYIAAFNNTAGRGELRVADVTTGNTTLIGPFEGGAEMCMAVVSESRPEWITLPQPDTTIGDGASDTLPVVVNTLPLVNEPSTNHAEIVFSGTFVNQPPRMPVTVILIPDALSITPDDQQSASGFTGGPFAPDSFPYAVSNQGASVISWSVSNDTAWLSLAATGGVLGAGAALNITPAINTVAETLDVGSYTGNLHFVNHATAVAQHRRIVLTVNPTAVDHFTELFTGANDLDGRMLTFTPLPDSPYYEVCSSNGLAAFPTDPSGGTPLALDDDDSVLISFTGGLKVPFFGTERSSLFVGSNGYLTFGSGDSDFGESLADHFNFERISALFDDLDPTSGGAISWRQLPDRVAVTWEAVPQFGNNDEDNMQVELFTNGMIRISWLVIDSTDGLAGLSQGLGTPGDFIMSDLSAYELCDTVVIPGLVITNPPTDIFVAPAVNAYDVGGICNVSIFNGNISWTNQLNGAAGTMPALASWLIPALPLAPGPNVIVVGAASSSLVAADHGTNSEYNSGWTPSSDGGFGWGDGWDLMSWNGTANFLMTSSDPGNLSAGPRAWTIAASNGVTGEAKRDFAAPMAVGHSFRMRFDNNWIENGNSVGFGLQNVAGDNLFEFLFIGGAATYIINDSTNSRATTIPWSGDGWDISFTRTGAGTYAFTCGVYTVRGALLSVADQNPARLKIWNYSAGSLWQHNLYVNDTRIVASGSSPASTNDSVTITRLVAGADGDADGIADDWELGHGLVIGDNDATNNPDADAWSNFEEFIADTDPHASNQPLRVEVMLGSNCVTLVAGPTTTNSRQYDVEISTNLPRSLWMPWKTNITGAASGNPLSIILTNEPAGGAARVGVHLP